MIVEEGVSLSGKNILVAVVVGDAGEGGRVGVEADCPKGGAIVAIATDEFLGQMQGLGRRAPVAAGVEGSAAIEDQGDRLDHRAYISYVIPKSADRINAAVNSLDEFVMHGEVGL